MKNCFNNHINIKSFSVLKEEYPNYFMDIVHLSLFFKKQTRNLKRHALKTLMLILCFCAMHLSSYAQKEAIQDIWKSANASYQTEAYHSAIIDYEKIISIDNKDATVFFNLGNAYFKNNNKGEAVLNYLRALQLRPGFSPAKENIKYIQSLNNNKIPLENSLFLIRWYNNFISVMSPNTLALVFILLLSITSFLFYKRLDITIKYVQRWLAFSSSMTVFSFLLAFFAFQESRMLKKAVVMHENTFLFDSAKKKQVRWNLPEGVILSVSNQHQSGLIFVTLDNGIKGWIDKYEIERVSFK
ncbi:MAG TPA: tetratricopeptide repeat protein [Edaphocola sp.]|nr:tetratricopeptide repeat protein [Edaphocola sp.]